MRKCVRQGQRAVGLMTVWTCLDWQGSSPHPVLLMPLMPLPLLPVPVPVQVDELLQRLDAEAAALREVRRQLGDAQAAGEATSRQVAALQARERVLLSDDKMVAVGCLLELQKGHSRRQEASRIVAQAFEELKKASGQWQHRDQQQCRPLECQAAREQLPHPALPRPAPPPTCPCPSPL